MGGPNAASLGVFLRFRRLRKSVQLGETYFLTSASWLNSSPPSLICLFAPVIKMEHACDHLQTCGAAGLGRVTPTRGLAVGHTQVTSDTRSVFKLFSWIHTRCSECVLTLL